jgi:hypothetical protein
VRALNGTGSVYSCSSGSSKCGCMLLCTAAAAVVVAAVMLSECSDGSVSMRLCCSICRNRLRKSAAPSCSMQPFRVYSVQSE